MKMKSPKTPESLLKIAATISEALPYLREFAGATFVIKYGGNAMGSEQLSQQFARDIVLLKHVGINPVVVHGGGPQIGAMLDRLKIQSEFIDGLRVTDKAAVEIVEMVLSGNINKQIVASITAAGGTAVGLSGKDGGMISARKLQRTKRDKDSNIERILDLGFVGEPAHINPNIIEEMTMSDIIPVIAPIGVGEDGETYNINADTVAGAIAGALRAEKLILLTDIAGIMTKDKQLISNLTIAEAKELIEDETITGGMIPKVETCFYALEHNAGSVHILDGRLPHALLVETFTSFGAGTMMVK
jgi:acetylglutamate kinase